MRFDCDGDGDGDGDWAVTRRSEIGFSNVVYCYTFFCPRSLESVKIELLQQLQNLQGAPSVQMQQVPPLFEVQRDETEDDPDERPKHKTSHGDGDRKVHESELYDTVD
jgi:hypothetical protein